VGLCNYDVKPTRFFNLLPKEITATGGLCYIDDITQDRTFNGSQMCIVTDPIIELAIGLIEIEEAI
jgi:hypothetical protein